MEPPSPRIEAESGPIPAAKDGFPDICGDFNMRIDRNGQWYYQGSPIGRVALVKLFATVLRRDDDGVYWLTTPVENGRIAVEDAPFIGVEMMTEGEGRNRIVRFRTNVDDVVVLDEAHPLRVDHDADSDGPRPYIYIRKGLEARLARAVYYHLVALAEAADDDPKVLGVWSSGRFFPLGRAE
jgi:hypothetical protein